MEEGTVYYEGVFRLKARQDNPGPIHLPDEFGVNLKLLRRP